MQVPVSLIERVKRAVLDTAFLSQEDAEAVWQRVAAALSQPTPSAERDDLLSCLELGDDGNYHWDTDMLDRLLERHMGEFPAAPPRIEDMAPGTTFTAVDPGRLGDRATFEVLNNHRGRNVETWVHWAPSSFISSTIRDVTPPKEPTA